MQGWWPGQLLETAASPSSYEGSHSTVLAATADIPCNYTSTRRNNFALEVRDQWVSCSESQVQTPTLIFFLIFLSDLSNLLPPNFVDIFSSSSWFCIFRVSCWQTQVGLWAHNEAQSALLLTLKFAKLRFGLRSDKAAKVYLRQKNSK